MIRRAFLTPSLTCSGVSTLSESVSSTFWARLRVGGRENGGADFAWAPTLDDGRSVVTDPWSSVCSSALR